MAKKTTKKVNNNELDGQEFFAAIAQIEQEKGIKPGYMMEKITQALVSAYRRDHEGVGDNLVVDANPETNTVRMFLKKDVVEEVDNPACEISLAEAQAALPRAQLGDVIRIEVKPKSFGRIAAQTARQVIIQGIREAEQGMVYDEFSSKEHELLTGVVTRIDPRSGAATVRISSGSTTASTGVREGCPPKPIFSRVSGLEITPQKLISEPVPAVRVTVTMGRPGFARGCPLPVPPCT